MAVELGGASTSLNPQQPFPPTPMRVTSQGSALAIQMLDNSKLVNTIAVLESNAQITRRDLAEAGRKCTAADHQVTELSKQARVLGDELTVLRDKTASQAATLVRLERVEKDNQQLETDVASLRLQLQQHTALPSTPSEQNTFQQHPDDVTSNIALLSPIVHLYAEASKLGLPLKCDGVDPFIAIMHLWHDYMIDEAHRQSINEFCYPDYERIKSLFTTSDWKDIIENEDDYEELKSAVDLFHQNWSGYATTHANSQQSTAKRMRQSRRTSSSRYH